MPDNTEPFEIVAAPFDLYLAPVGTTFPEIDHTPNVAWTRVGSSGPKNVDEAGVTVAHGQTLSLWRSLGTTGPRKAFRTEESLTIRLTLVDLTLEQYRTALNGNTIDTTAAGAGTPGYKTLGLSRGLTVTRYALLIRGTSPYGDNLSVQYRVPIVVEQGSQEVVGKKGDPAGLALEFQALENPDAATEDSRFGYLDQQTDAAET